jgi:putative hydrolase of the HAD superfamily
VFYLNHEVHVIRSVIFDLGGTLLNFDGTARDWRGMEARGISALYCYLAGRGYTLPEREFEQVTWDMMRLGWQEAMAGRDNACLPNLLGLATASFGVSLSDDERMQAARVYATGVEEGLVPFEGACEALQQLKARGLRLGLLSNTTWPGQFHRQELERFDLIEFFDEMAFTCELGVWKPNVGAFHHVTKVLGVAPAEAVYVGDQPQIDLFGAQQAGLRTVLMAALPRDLDGVKPDAIVHRLAELPAVLDRLS